MSATATATAFIDPTVLELTPDQEALLRGAGADWYPTMRADLLRFDQRLSAIDSELGVKTVGKGPKLSQQKRAALEQERLYIQEQRTTTTRAFAALAHQANEKLAALQQSRGEAAQQSEAILQEINKVSWKIDALLTDLCRALTERKQAIEKLRVLMGDESLRRYLHRDCVTQAMGRAGLREFAFLGGAKESDHLKLHEHDEQLLSSSVRNEALRITRRNRERLDA